MLVFSPSRLRGLRFEVVLVDDDAATDRIAEIGGTIRLALDGVGGAATARLVKTLSQRGELVGYADMEGHSAPGELRDLIFMGHAGSAIARERHTSEGSGRRGSRCKEHAASIAYARPRRTLPAESDSRAAGHRA